VLNGCAAINAVVARMMFLDNACQFLGDELLGIEVVRHVAAVESQIYGAATDLLVSAVVSPAVEA
jgi:hypothetical protein